MNKVSFFADPGGNESIAPDETNIVTRKNWGKKIPNAVKAVRGCGNDVALSKFKKQKTAEADEVDKATDNVPTHTVPQNLKDGAPSPANDEKRKADNETPLKGNFGATNKVSPPTCGRKSAKSHEPVHTLISRMKEAVKRMTSTEKMFNTIFTSLMADLKPDVAEKKEKVAEKRGAGKKRGQYQTSRTSRRQDKIEFSASIFGNTVEVEGKAGGFVELAGVGGRILGKFKKDCLFVKTARAPDE